MYPVNVSIAAALPDRIGCHGSVLAPTPGAPAASRLTRRDHLHYRVRESPVGTVGDADFAGREG